MSTSTISEVSTRNIPTPKSPLIQADPSEATIYRTRNSEYWPLDNIKVQIPSHTEHNSNQNDDQPPSRFINDEESAKQQLSWNLVEKLRKNKIGLDIKLKKAVLRDIACISSVLKKQQYLSHCKKSPSGDLVPSKLLKSNLAGKRGGPFSSFLLKNLVRQTEEAFEAQTIDTESLSKIRKNQTNSLPEILPSIIHPIPRNPYQSKFPNFNAEPTKGSIARREL